MLALAILQENVVILSLSTEVTLLISSSHLISLKLQDFVFYVMCIFLYCVSDTIFMYFCRMYYNE